MSHLPLRTTGQAWGRELQDHCKVETGLSPHLRCWRAPPLLGLRAGGRSGRDLNSFMFREGIGRENQADRLHPASKAVSTLLWLFASPIWIPKSIT